MTNYIEDHLRNISTRFDSICLTSEKETETRKAIQHRQ